MFDHVKMLQQESRMFTFTSISKWIHKTIQRYKYATRKKKIEKRFKIKINFILNKKNYYRIFVDQNQFLLNSYIEEEEERKQNYLI